MENLQRHIYLNFLIRNGLSVYATHERVNRYAYIFNTYASSVVSLNQTTYNKIINLYLFYIDAVAMSLEHGFPECATVVFANGNSKESRYR